MQKTSYFHFYLTYLSPKQQKTAQKQLCFPPILSENDAIYTFRRGKSRHNRKGFSLLFDAKITTFGSIYRHKRKE
ncbi:hypothetical protein B5F77_01710 [Parabacteroides sp. An277]|nr:hypothetical protein B5F77_01710 [Parabacteroides sp. An277]